MSTTESLALGIDAGGTYTDAVVYDLGGRRLAAKAKALTTRPDPTDGIAEALERLAFDRWPALRYVALSTTFATNAIVEGRCAKAGLLLIGYPRFLFDEIRFEPKAAIDGRIDVEGNQHDPLDAGALIAQAAAMVRRGVCALAVSGMYAVVNPAHELQAARLLTEQFKLPIVQGHQLSMALDARSRAVTARLNAGLLPLIDGLIASVQKVLAANHISAPLCLVKGDGSIVSAEYGRTRPVELIMSGPAGSVAGGRHLLADREPQTADDAIVADIGGTTTDIGMIRNGHVRILDQGAKVSDFQTHVKAIDIRTVGLGGDSRVRIDHEGRIHVGPQRVLPLSCLTARETKIMERLEQILAEPVPSLLYDPADFFLLLRSPTGELPDHDRRIVEALADGPMDRGRLADRLGLRHPSLLNLGELEEHGHVLQSCLTPTDTLIALGRLDLWDRRAARVGLELSARRLGLGPDALAERILQEVHLRLGSEVLLAGCLAETDGRDGAFHAFEQGPRLGRFIESVLRRKLLDQDGAVVAVDLALRRPVVLVGAPAESCLQPLRQLLGEQVRTVEHGEVANAVGAVVGRVVIRLTGEITVDEDERYHVHVAEGRFEFEDLAAAKDFAREHLRRQALAELARAGGRNGQVEVDLDDHFGEVAGTASLQRIYLRTALAAQATGRPAATVEQR